MGLFTDQAIFGALNQMRKGKETAVDNLRLAIANGGDVNAHGWGHGLTPLMRWIQILAESDASPGMLPVLILLEAGADPLKRDKSGRLTAIDYAEEMGFAGIVETMKQHAEINSMYRELGLTRRP